MGEVVRFRAKRLSGFIPDELPEPAKRNLAEPIFDHRDTSPCEYVAPEVDPA